MRPVKLVVLVTINVARDTPLDCHFSAWSRPKPAPDPLPGPSVASGVIPTKGGRNGVLQPPAGRAPQGRWRSSPWKRCNHAAPRGRVREHPAPLGALRLVGRPSELTVLDSQGAPRTARCIKTARPGSPRAGCRRQGAPRTARCIKTGGTRPPWPTSCVRDHPAPLGALRHVGVTAVVVHCSGQGPPRTARCIKTRADSRADRKRSSGSTPHR